MGPNLEVGYSLHGTGCKDQRFLSYFYRGTLSYLHTNSDPRFLIMTERCHTLECLIEVFLKIGENVLHLQFIKN